MKSQPSQTESHRLNKIQHLIEQFFYKAHYNVILHSLLRNKKHAAFKREVYSALKRQMLYFAKIQTVNYLVGIYKSEDIPQSEILTRLEKIWTPIDKFIPEGAFHDYLEWVMAHSLPAIFHQLDKPVPTIETNKKLFNKLNKTIDKQVGKSIALIDSTTQDWISRMVQQALNKGSSHYEIARMMHAGAAKIADYRAEVIAEQEAALYLGEMTLAIYKSSGIIMKRFITSRDEAVCDICVADEAAGLIGIDEDFPSGTKAPPVHVGCRCFIQPVVQQL